MYALSKLFEDIEIKNHELNDVIKSITLDDVLKNEITSKQVKLEVDINLANTLFIESILDFFEDHEEINDYQIKIPNRKISIEELYDTYLELVILNQQYVRFDKSEPIRRSIENCIESLMNLSVYRGKPDQEWCILYLQNSIKKLLYTTFIEPVISSDTAWINKPFTNGETLLMMEIRLKCPLYMIEDLLRLGANSNSQDDKGCTPLMYSTCHHYNANNERLVSLLTQYGADLKVLDNHGVSYGKYYLLYKIKEINSDASVGEEYPSLKRLEMLNSSDGPLIKYFPLKSFKEEDKLTSEEYFKFSKIFSKDYEHLPIPLFIRNSPSWIFDEVHYNQIKESQPDLYQKIISWD